MSAQDRNANLDLLRALAIVLVVVYHVAQMWPVPLPRVRVVSALGAYGVDLFFVLSGWLIGSLFWKEWALTGRVGLGRFVLRRLLRTIPCYLVALLLAWAAVRLGAPERAGWDWGYVLFLQNYYSAMPYFLISWSLCVEEHFYLLAPLGFWLLARVGPRWAYGAGCLCLLPWLCRSGVQAAELSAFGPEWTASHLRFEGLLGAFLLARVARCEPALWSRLLKAAWPAAVGLLALAIGLYYASALWFYRVGISVLALGFLALLMALVQMPPSALARQRWVRWVALTSYSTYLTHALMIHVARLCLSRVPFDSDLVRLLVFVVLIGLGSACFYWIVEKSSLALRDRWVPGPVLRPC